jgi:hypothetical protein
MAAIARERPGVTDVYGLVFAPYAAEDVFLRESTMVSRVLAERFDAEGRVVHLVNHATTAQTHLWATTLNLQRAIDAIAQRMDRDNDLLVVYMTSHGASDFKLAAVPLAAAGATAQPRRAARGARQGRHPPPRDRHFGLLLGRLGRSAGRRHHPGHDGGRRHPHLLRLRPPVRAHLLRPRPVRRAAAQDAFLRAGLCPGRAADQAARDRRRQGRRLFQPADPGRAPASAPVLRALEKRLDALRCQPPPRCRTRASAASPQFGRDNPLANPAIAQGRGLCVMVGA